MGDHSVILGKVKCGPSVSHIVAARSGCNKWEVVCGSGCGRGVKSSVKLTIYKSFIYCIRVELHGSGG